MWQNEKLSILFSQWALRTAMNSHTLGATFLRPHMDVRVKQVNACAGGLREEGGSEAASKEISILQSN